MELELEITEGAVRGVVRDGAEWAGTSSDGLAGLRVAGSVADEAEVHREPEGTSVSFELRQPWTESKASD